MGKFLTWAKLDVGDIRRGRYAMWASFLGGHLLHVSKIRDGRVLNMC